VLKLKKSKVARWVKGEVGYQLTDMRSVKLHFTWSDKDRAFYIDSPAGLIKYKPKTMNAQTVFRNRFINEFAKLMGRDTRGQDIRKDLFRLYRQIKKEYKVSYKANFRTRLQCFLSR
jgi:hypothetical protein